MEVNFCRRCGDKLESLTKYSFKCMNSHVIYASSAPAVCVVLARKDGKVAIIKRALNPGKGSSHLPGGFLNGAETLEDALAREVSEEIGLISSQYSKPVYILSGNDEYEFAGEVVTSVTAVYYAEITDTMASLRANDDAASVSFETLSHTLADALFFPTLRQALHELANSSVPQYTE